MAETTHPPIRATHPRQTRFLIPIIISHPALYQPLIRPMLLMHLLMILMVTAVPRAVVLISALMSMYIPTILLHSPGQERQTTQQTVLTLTQEQVEAVLYSGSSILMLTTHHPPPSRYGWIWMTVAPMNVMKNLTWQRQTVLTLTTLTASSIPGPSQSTMQVMEKSTIASMPQTEERMQRVSPPLTGP